METSFQELHELLVKTSIAHVVNYLDEVFESDHLVTPDEKVNKYSIHYNWLSSLIYIDFIGRINFFIENRNPCDLIDAIKLIDYYRTCRLKSKAHIDFNLISRMFTLVAEQSAKLIHERDDYFEKDCINYESTVLCYDISLLGTVFQFNKNNPQEKEFFNDLKSLEDKLLISLEKYLAKKWSLE